MSNHFQRRLAELAGSADATSPGSLAMADAAETLVSFGGALKALDDAGRVGGYLVLFGDPEHTDASENRDFFTPETDFGLDLSTKCRVLYHHGLDPKLGNRSLGTAELKIDETGVWMEGQLALRDEYEKKILAMVRADKQGLSSGTANYLVRREKQANGAHKILSWPLGLDASITPTPAEPRTACVALKSLILDAEIKGAALGEHAGAMAASAAIDRLHGMAMMRIGGHMSDHKAMPARSDRMDACKAVLDEYHATALKTIDALMDDEDGDEAAIKALIRSASARLHAGLKLADHLESVRAAVTGLSDRLHQYAELKATDGRRVPADRRAAIKALADDLAALWSATAPTPRHDPDADRAMAEEFLRIQARFVGLNPN